MWLWLVHEWRGTESAGGVVSSTFDNTWEVMEMSRSRMIILCSTNWRNLTDGMGVNGKRSSW